MIQQTIFSSGDSYFASLLTDLRAATQTIALETYIFNPDPLGQEVAKELIKAAQRGVQVRILVDGAGSSLWGGKLTLDLERVGIQTRIFHPFPWRTWHWSRSHVRTPFLLKMIYLFLKINSRNHRKICLIDNRIAYVGSFNITQDHLSEQQKGKGWRDTAVKITGADLQPLADAFNAAWDHQPIKERLRKMFRQINTNPIFRINNTRHRRRLLYKDLLHRMLQCKKRIWMTNAYFVPDNFLLRSIIEKAEDNLDVRILLPKDSDIFFMTWASSAFYYNLLKAGVRIFEYLPSNIHAKVLMMDDWVIVGSSNLNHRSLLHDLEADVNICDPQGKQAIEQQFLIDLKNSREISLSNWRVRPFYQRFIGKLLLYLKYWI
ncbi:MAG: phospholipase D-like domain-containing protein [Gammaproteobacteria bacterium]